MDSRNRKSVVLRLGLGPFHRSWACLKEVDLLERVGLEKVDLERGQTGQSLKGVALSILAVGLA